MADNSNPTGNIPPADALWLAQQHSAARLAAQQMLMHAADNTPTGQSLAASVAQGLKTYAAEQLKSANTAARKQALTDALSSVADEAMAKAKVLEQGQNAANATAYFRQTLDNMSQLYGALPYGEIDRQFGQDAGALNSTLKKLPLPEETRTQMQGAMLQQLTHAANTAKLQQDPQLYLTEQFLARKPAERNADESLPQALRDHNPGQLQGPYVTPEQGLLAMAQDAVTRGGKADRPAALAAHMHGAIQKQYGAQPYAPDSIRWAASKAMQPETARQPPLSSAPEGSGLSATQQDDNGQSHVQNGSASFTMGTADQQRQWLQQALLARAGVNAQNAQAAQQQANAGLQQRRQTASSLIDKFSQGNLTRADISASGLSPDAQAQAIAMMSRGPAAAGNAALHRQLFLQALNGAVQDKSDLLPHLARPDGLNPSQAHNVAAALQLAGEPYVKRFVKSAENPIMGVRGFVADPDGGQQYSNMLMDLVGQISDAQKKGLSPRDILDRDSKHYVGDRLINAYARTADERRHARFNAKLDDAADQGLPVPRAEEVPDEFIRRQKEGR